MTLQQKWHQLSQRFLQLQARERVLAALTVLAAVLVLGWWLAIEPALERIGQARGQTASLEQEIADVASRLEAVEQALAVDPNAPLRQRRERIGQRLAETGEELERLAARLVSPDAMVSLLRQMLSQHQGLTLESVSHEPATPIRLAGESDPQAGIYQHRVLVTVQGRYFQLVEYLQALEALDDRLGWGGVRYEVQEWPRGRLRIELKTLSLSEEWLGV